MARKITVTDDMTVNYKKIREIVNQVTSKYGVEVVLNQARSTDGFSF